MFDLEKNSTIDTWRKCAFKHLFIRLQSSFQHLLCVCVCFWPVPLFLSFAIQKRHQT